MPVGAQAIVLITVSKRHVLQVLFSEQSSKGGQACHATCVCGCSPCCHVPGPSAFRSVVAEASFLWAVRRKDTERRFHPLLPVFGFVNPKLFLHSLMFLLEQLLVSCSHCSQSKHLKMEKQNEILDQISPIHHELIKKIK